VFKAGLAKDDNFFAGAGDFGSLWAEEVLRRHGLTSWPGYSPHSLQEDRRGARMATSPQSALEGVRLPRAVARRRGPTAGPQVENAGLPLQAHGRWDCCQHWCFLTPTMTPTGLDEAGFRWTGARQSCGH
jgi:hypothetical protein